MVNKTLSDKITTMGEVGAMNDDRIILIVKDVKESIFNFLRDLKNKLRSNGEVNNMCDIDSHVIYVGDVFDFIDEAVIKHLGKEFREEQSSSLPRESIKDSLSNSQQDKATITGQLSSEVKSSTPPESKDKTADTNNQEEFK